MKNFVFNFVIAFLAIFLTLGCRSMGGGGPMEGGGGGGPRGGGGGGRCKQCGRPIDDQGQEVADLGEEVPAAVLDENPNAPINGFDPGISDAPIVPDANGAFDPSVGTDVLPKFPDTNIEGVNPTLPSHVDPAVLPEQPPRRRVADEPEIETQNGDQRVEIDVEDEVKPKAEPTDAEVKEPPEQKVETKPPTEPSEPKAEPKS